MNTATLTSKDYGWASPAQPTYNVTQTIRGVARKIVSFATISAVNEIPVCGAVLKIMRLKSWEANWDGANALPVNSIAITRATALIDEMYSFAFQSNLDWCDPNVTASPNGEVVLEWWNQEKKLTIYVGENQADFLKVWGSDIDEEMEDGILSDEQTGHLLTWLET